MPLLQDLLNNVALRATAGPTDRDIRRICFDSREVGEGDLFVAVSGTLVDGHRFIAQALSQGAAAVVQETDLAAEESPGQATLVQVPDSSAALGQMAANYFGRPSEQMKVVAVTGTNGKTTVATLLHQLFTELGYRVGLLSTVEYRIGEIGYTATHTTPNALRVQELLAKMVEGGCTHCFMEASSHALVQHRITGTAVDVAVFTNITKEHLDYHGTFENYIKAKQLLFDRLAASSHALANADDKRGAVMLQNTKASKHFFALKRPAEFKGKVIANTLEGMELMLNDWRAWFRLVGQFNAYNLSAVFGTAVLLDEAPEEVTKALSQLRGAPGRFEHVAPDSGRHILVDYAHTPDALENVLKTLSELRTKNETLYTVFGCGGGRDTAKRKAMAEVACRYSDRILMTSDNPRNEDPEQILDDMEAGVPPQDYKKVLRITDRRQAIRAALQQAQPGDIVLVAGKGHETYQEIRGVRHPFDDRQVIRQLLNHTQN